MAMIAGSTVIYTACNHKKLEPDPEPTRDVEVKFSSTNVDTKLAMKTLQELVQDKTIKNIYLTVSGCWDGCTAINISESRNNFFQPRIDLSPKMHGRGDFDFKLGEASKVPEDSLWFVKQGWTINKKYQNQK